MLVVFPPIFVADTKIIYGYNFVAPLNFRGEDDFEFAKWLKKSIKPTLSLKF